MKKTKKDSNQTLIVSMTFGISVFALLFSFQLATYLLLLAILIRFNNLEDR